MSQINGFAGVLAPQREDSNAADALNDLDLDHFLELMIAELQNQDPLNPLENNELLQQISQIREVGATDNLNSTLESVLLGQNVASATGLIGQDVRALSIDGTPVNGVVERVTIIDGEPRLHVAAEESGGRVSSADGEIEAGTYNYQVVFAGAPDEPLHAIDIGPITTTGTAQLDQSIELRGLPATVGPKLIFRTDASGTGDYTLVAEIEDGTQTTYTDTAAAGQPDKLLRATTQQYSGSSRFTVNLRDVAEIRLRANDNEE